MAYRVAKKITKTTQYKCLKCKNCKQIDSSVSAYGCTVECNAPNKCITSHFNARDFYCVEFKSINEMDNYEQRKLQEKIQTDYSKKAYKEYCNKYYPKKMAQKMYKDKFGK